MQLSKKEADAHNSSHSSRIVVALVDRFPPSRHWYTYELADSLLQVGRNRVRVLLYGPKRRSHRALHEGVWTSTLYPLQITRKSIADKLDIVHIQFEFVTFGTPITSLLVIPLIVLLRLLRKGVIVTLHGPIFPPYLKKDSLESLMPFGMRFPTRLMRLTVLGCYLLMSKFSSALITHSDVFRNWLSAFGIDRCYTVHHGVSADEANFGKYENHKNQKTYILFFGVLSPRKGIENLIMAYSIARNHGLRIPLVIAGAEPSYFKGYKRTLRALCRKIGLGKSTEFKGYVHDDQVEHLLQNATALVLPYRFSESASGILSIALQYGVPVIATKTEYFIDTLGKNYGMLVEPDNTSKLAEALLKITRFDTLRRRFSKAITKRALEYSWSKIAAQTVELYEITKTKSLPHQQH